MERHLIWFVAAGHLFADISQGVVPTLLPFFIVEYNLSYAAAAGLVSALSIASTVVQPLFGYYADRHSRPWLIPIGVLFAGYGVAFCSLISNYYFSIFAIIISGIGIAAFHPEGARFVHILTGEKKATGMSIFAVGGQAGIAIGPIITMAVIGIWGLKGTLSLIVPFTIVTIFLAHQVLVYSEDQISPKGRQVVSATLAAKDAWVPFILLTATVICRSIIVYGLNTFIPLYWINILHQSKAAGGTALSIMFGAGIIGTLVGGRLADKYGHRNIILTGFGTLIPLSFVFVSIKNVNVMTALLVPIGVVLLSTYSPLVVLGQKYLPNRIGFASGITLGVAVAIGGIMAPILGHIADGHGIPTAMTVLAFLPILGVILAFMLPYPHSS